MVFRDYAEYFSALRRQWHTSANDFNTVMCQTRKTKRQISFHILDVGGNIPSLPNKQSI